MLKNMNVQKWKDVGFYWFVLKIASKEHFFELKSRQRNIRRKEKRIAFAVRLVS